MREFNSTLGMMINAEIVNKICNYTPIKNLYAKIPKNHVEGVDYFILGNDFEASIPSFKILNKK